MKTDAQLQALSKIPGGIGFHEKIKAPLTARGVDILQINVGRRCNLSCRHCHVEAGPDRNELMRRETFEKCLSVLKSNSIGTIDITGGSPEMNPEFEWFLKQAHPLGRRLMVRSNLVILTDDAYKHFIELYAHYGVEVIASVPAFDEARFERQRGAKTFYSMIEAVKKLNRLGYGRPGSGLLLDLVHNPVGAYLPGSQTALEADFRSRLSQDYGIFFNRLLCLTNCPVGRYLEYLIRSDNYADYMRSLICAFNRTALDNVMCRTTISVGWEGTLYDCDFNQMLALPVNHDAPDHMDVFNMDQLKFRRIVIGNHCFSCTAGAGSSCQGAIAKAGE